MKKIFILMFILISSFGIAQTYTWTNADMDNDFENPNNWNPVPMFGFPSAGETVVFDGTVSNANCNMPNDNTLNLINMLASYTGVLDASGINLDIVNLNLAGGTLSAPTGTLKSLHGTIQQVGAGVFTNNGGTVEHEVINSTVRSVNGTFNFGTYKFLSSGSAGNRTINFNGSSTAQNLILNPSTYSFSLRGSINVTDRLDLLGSSTVAAPNNTGSIVFTGATTKTITGTTNPLENRI
ncbi:MAG TPA: hypothetical protein PLU73_05330, partial [Bacteroidia bacterium]|nr:hypothetical protein [Bacteroidia bacterium]